MKTELTWLGFSWDDLETIGVALTRYALQCESDGDAQEAKHARELARTARQTRRALTAVSMLDIE